jgi:hypothetical protein
MNLTNLQPTWKPKYTRTTDGHDWTAGDYYAVEALCGEVVAWCALEGSVNIDGGYGSTVVSVHTVYRMRPILKDEAYILGENLRLRADMMRLGQRYHIEVEDGMTVVRPNWPLVDLLLDEGRTRTFLCLVCWRLVTPVLLGIHAGGCDGFYYLSKYALL